MQVIEGIYSELSFSVGLIYIGFFHMLKTWASVILMQILFKNVKSP